MNVDFGKLLNYKVRVSDYASSRWSANKKHKSQFYGWVAFGPKTMSVVGGQMNNIHPSCASCVES